MTRRSEDEEVWAAPVIGPGSAHAVSGDPEEGDVVGRLLLPDPEQRHHWREVYVRAPVRPARRIGFQPPRASRG